MDDAIIEMGIKELREETRIANRFMREAKRKIDAGTADAYTERAYWKARQRMRMFQVKHNQHKGYQFSMKGLNPLAEDALEPDEFDYASALEIYTHLIKSVTENVRLNPELSEKHRESQVKFYQDQGWASNETSAQALYDFKNSAIFEELMDMNLSDIPSEIMERYAKFVDADYDVNDFSNMITVFNKQITLGNKNYKDVKDFYKFTDRYMKLMKEREFDFNKGVSDFIKYKGDRYKDFFSFMEQF